MRKLNISPISDLIYTWWHGRSIDASLKHDLGLNNKSQKSSFFSFVSRGGKK